jgi:hypothetical protein
MAIVSFFATLTSGRPRRLPQFTVGQNGLADLYRAQRVRALPGCAVYVHHGLHRLWLIRRLDSLRRDVVDEEGVEILPAARRSRSRFGAVDLKLEDGRAADSRHQLLSRDA